MMHIMGRSAHTSWQRKLGDVFTFGEARRAGLSQRAFYKLREEGEIVAIAHGLYRHSLADIGDVDLVEIAERAPVATLCLETALARHGLVDAIPTAIDVAIPRGTTRPALTAPIRLHSFDSRTFDIGREDLDVGARQPISIYSPERCIIDAVRLRHRQGTDLAWEALRRWVGLRGSNPATMVRMAASFHGAEDPIRLALDILQ
jgi:predicted transcriptional regulator of viral defense system